jgi:transposase-like protein
VLNNFDTNKKAMGNTGFNSGEVIAKMMEKSQLKVAAVARIVGVHRATLYNWIESFTLEPEKILRVEAATNVSVMEVSPAAEEYLRANGYRGEKRLQDDELTAAKVYNMLEDQVGTANERADLYKRVSQLERYLTNHGIDTTTGQKLAK